MRLLRERVGVDCGTEAFAVSSLQLSFSLFFSCFSVVFVIFGWFVGCCFGFFTYFFS